MKNLRFIIFIVLAYMLCPFITGAQTGWQWGVSSVYSPIHDPGFKIMGAATDDSGNVLVTGVTSGYIPWSAMTDIVVYGTDTLRNMCDCQQHAVVKTDSNGNFLWVRGSDHATTKPMGIATDHSGNVYVLGRYDSGTISFGPYTLFNPTFCMYYLVKYSAGGSELWARNICGSPRLLGTGGIGVDGAGNAYVSGYFNVPSITIDGITLTNNCPTGDTSDVFVAKFDPTGSAIWAMNFGGKKDEIPYALTVTPAGNMYLTGFFSSDTMLVGSIVLPDSVGVPIAPGTPFFIKLDSSGHVLWARKYNAGLEIYGLAADAAENIYVTGLLKGDLVLGSDTLDDLGIFNTYLAKYDPDGAVLWARCAGGNYVDQGWSIAVDNCDNVLIAGSAWGMMHMISGYTMSFGTSVLAMPAVNWDPSFVAHYSTSGVYQSSIALPSGGYGYVLANKRGSYYLAGTYLRVPMVFGPDSLVAPLMHLNQELFVAKNRYGCSSATLGVNDVVQGEGLALYPNPATEECTIYCSRGFAPETKAALYDLTGRLKGTYRLSGSNTVISLAGLVAGIYLCRVINGEGEVANLRLEVEK